MAVLGLELQGPDLWLVGLALQITQSALLPSSQTSEFPYLVLLRVDRKLHSRGAGGRDPPHKGCRGERRGEEGTALTSGSPETRLPKAAGLTRFHQFPLLLLEIIFRVEPLAPI